MGTTTTTGPSTPERTPRIAQMRLGRSFTVPARMPPTISGDAGDIPASRTGGSSSSAAEIGAAAGIETMFVHPSAKVIKFSASGRRPGSGVGREAQEPGTLPWASPTETTLATGPLEIYRVPGSVSFIHSGPLLHAIMPRSQCWCVDGKSKFAIRVALPDTYYRIELPGDSPADMEKVAEFEFTLRRVLFYERTACPFKRSFSVELPPEELQPEGRKKNRRKSHGPAKKWRLARAYSWKPEDGEEESSPRAEGEEEYGSVSDSSEEHSGNYESSFDEGQSDASGLADEVQEISFKTPTRPSVRERIASLTATRSVTSPPQYTLSHTPPSRLRSFVTLREEVHERELSNHATPLDPSRLQTFQEILTTMPPSPPESSAGAEPYEATSRMEEASDMGVDSRIGTPPSKTLLAAADISVASSPEAHLPSRESSPFRTTDAVQLQSLASESSPLESSDDTEPISPRTTRPSGEGSSQLESELETLIPEEFPEADADALSDDEPRPTKPHPEPQVESQEDIVDTSSHDPFAAIQARIQARRSIGGRGAASSAPLASSGGPQHPPMPTTRPLASKASISRLSQAQHQQQQALATALMRKAVTKVLGPPASLVAIMLKIAARFAAVDFGFEKTPDHLRRVPGSFDLDGSDLEDFDVPTTAGGDEEEEDDFGVPIRSPVRNLAMADLRTRMRNASVS